MCIPSSDWDHVKQTTFNFFLRSSLLNFQKSFCSYTLWPLGHTRKANNMFFIPIRCWIYSKVKTARWTVRVWLSWVPWELTFIYGAPSYCFQWRRISKRYFLVVAATPFLETSSDPENPLPWFSVNLLSTRYKLWICATTCQNCKYFCVLRFLYYFLQNQIVQNLVDSILVYVEAMVFWEYHRLQYSK